MLIRYNKKPMRNRQIFRIVTIVLMLYFIAGQAYALDYPHTTVNGISCPSCHYIIGITESLLVDVSGHSTGLDDSIYNNLCWGCHNDVDAVDVETHSYLQADNGYGDWSVECRTCHNPHTQDQVKEYTTATYLTTGTSDTPNGIQIDNPDAGKSTLTDSTKNWTTNEFQNLSVIPDTGYRKYGYKILSNTTDTLTVDGLFNTSYIVSGDTYAVVYGKIIKDTISTDEILVNSPTTKGVGDKTVRFFNATGANSFADGDSTYDGVCEVCHTMTEHFRNDGNGSDQLHTNVGTPAATDCMVCHSHTSGFAHGSGASGAGTNCVKCHGHDAGTNYDPDASTPYSAGGTASQGKGTYVAHSTHTETDTGDYDNRGPGIYCNTCHDISNMPYFASGTDANTDGNISLSETDVCDTCHSPGGSYDGVDNAIVGAKNNWSISASSASKIYNGTALQSGKEKWCVTCHDEAATASVISSVTAPNIAGDEDDTSYTYGSLSGTGWGFYKTGHGLSSGSTYPESGGVVSGAGKECLDCHLSTPDHIDGLARTFDDDNSGTDQSSEYRIGYRLQQVGGQEPMLIPKNNDGNSASDYRLCMQAGCHPDDGTGPYLDSTNLNTNMRKGNSVGDNLHNYHLDNNNAEYSPDWDGGGSISEPTCVVCHNVHGSKRLVMLRDGTLTGATDGFEIWYYNPNIVESGNPPSPADLPLSASTGTLYQRTSPQDFCAASCHDGILVEVTRDPYQTVTQAPTLDWTGETNYTSDGVNPNSGAGESNFVFRVEYTDTNNDAPTFIQVWVDEDDDAIYQADEKYNMTAANTVDTNYTNGKFYTKTLALSRAGDNTLNYRFYATDGSDATGTPTSDQTVSITNNAPTLTWTGESYYVSDGVNPDTGGTGANFEFRVKYTDTDNTAPSSIQVWVDEDDDGTYQTDEKYTMTVDGGDSNYANGELYTKTLTLSYVSDGSYNYRFYASDGTVDATGSPTSNSTVTVQSSANNPPSLEWSAATCLTDGVKPASGLASGNFEFKIKYTDADSGDGCPTTDTSAIQVWLDEDDSAAYEADEKYNLVEDDASDTDCTDGKIYKVTRQIGYAGDGVYNYRFYATDGTDTAIGDPVTTGSTVTVLSTTGRLGVRTGSETGPTWFGSIQDAIDQVNGTNTVLVYEGTYDEGTYLYFNGTNDNDTTVQSVCGADSTIISAPGTVVYFLSNTGSTLDGFQVTGGTTGVYLNSAAPTITNSKIHSISGRGIDTGNSGSILTLSNSEVYLNTASGIYINAGTGHTVTNSTIRDNTGSSGAGVYTTGPITFTDTTIKDNTSTGAGAGVFSNTVPLEFYRCTITGNVASGQSGAIELNNSGATASLENCIVTDNKGSRGGVAFINGGSLTAINSTFANNQATSTDGGVFSNNSGTITVRNSIFWNNQANTVGHIVYFNGGTMVISDSIMNNDGDGDFTDVPYFDNGSPTVSGYTSESDPLFVNESGRDYHIQSSSNAIDNASATYAPANDIDSESRPQGSADDIGADEYVSANNGPVLTWTGETNYASDGVNPNSGAGESSFEFRITYTDADNDAPSSIQIWVDEDDSGTYTAGEKYDMSAVNNDTVYTDGRLYTKTLTLSFAGDTNLNYRFYASDGTVDATGTPTSDSTVTVTNNVPTLAWTGEANYTTDGVNPNSNTSGNNFEFRIDYTDIDNAAPTYIEVWVDEDDSGTYDLGEKYSMTETNAGDTVYTDGKRYTKTLAISYVGDGILNYRFYASDGTVDATGTPTSNSTLTVTNAPVLGWTGETNYVSDGVNPDSAPGGSSFEFRIKYTDAGDIAPTSIQVWVDENDNLVYDAGEKYAMTEVDALDTIYTDGKLYSKTLTIADAGDGNLNYRFYATNGTDDAIGTPTSDSTVSINYAPTLAWTGETNYTSDGVDPDGAASGSNFTFRVKYTDQDNAAPTSIQLWLDEDDSGTYTAGEKYDMTIDGGDSDYTNGELYAKTLAVSSAGDDTLSYLFYASDGTDDATGAPATGGTISIISTLTVPGQYATIQEAINASSTGDTITVSDGTYSENIDFTGKNVTVISVNGAAVTIIQGDGSDAPVVTFSNGESSSAILDGFTINNQGSASASMRGVYIISNSSPTIRNSIIRGNNPAYYNGGGANIYISGGGATIENTTIGGVSGTPDSCVNGAGIYAQNASTGAITITGSTISYNSSDGGAGIYLANRTTTTTISSTTFSNNSASQNGGAIYSTNSPLEITGGTISSNTSTYDGAGLYLTGSSTTATITGTSFTGNSGRIGGAIYANGSGALSISSATIDSNNGSSSGAGIYMTNTTGASTITNTSISSNTGTASGAGIYFSSSATTSLTLTNVNVDNNTVTNTVSYDGGGLYLSGASVTVNITGGTINGNTTRGGGGILAGGGIDLTISGTTINSNDADSSGGGISISGTIDYTSTLDISKCVISGNVADDYGAGIYVGGYTTATITNCTITGNLVETGYDGGGVYDGSTTNIYSSTIAGNYAKRYGGGLRATANTTVTNSIIWGNAAGTSGPQITGTPGSITYTDIQGGGFAGTGNIDSDPLFTDEQAATSTTPTTSGNFHISSIASPVVDTGTSTGSPADDIDGDSRPLGSGHEMGSDEYVPPAPAVPTLDWTGETNYTTDGVNPDSAAGGSNFEFRIKYTDVNNDAPSSIQVWVDEDDSGTYEIGEKYDMTEVDAGDTNRTDGKLYTKTLTVNKAGDGTLNYRLYAADGTGDATGTPISDSTLTVTNNTPTIAWTGEANYTADGVDPNNGADGGSFTFRVDYTDLDNDAPSSIQVWVDEDDSGTYEVGEKYTMTETDAGDTTYTDGKRYTKALTLNTAGDSILNYRFYASDGTADATGTPTSDSTVTVGSSNNAPALAWTGESGYTTDGVNPDSGAGSFEFRIDYSDSDDEAPVTIEVWVDEDDSGTYSVGEKYAMTAVDSGDTLYTDGKLYTKTLALSYAVDGIFNYTFYATDGTSDATGTPTSNSTVTVVDSLDVPGEYATIQAAIDAASDGDIVLVSDNTYSENINYGGKNITVQSVNGAAVTTIQGSGTDAAVVTFNTSETSSAVLDGFTIDNSTSGNNTRGIIIDGGASPTIKNSKINGNTPASWQIGGGIYIDQGGMTLEDSWVGESGAGNTAGLGAGIYIKTATGGPYVVSITDSTISYNTGTNGVGIYILTGFNGTISISGSTISYNSSSSNYGAGIYSAAAMTITNTNITNNYDTNAYHQGAGMYLTGSYTTTFTGGSISDNTAYNGGGIYVAGGADLTVDGGAVISGNVVDGGSGGGAQVNGAGSTLTCSKASFKGNDTRQYGGGIYNYDGAVTLTNCNVTGNTADYYDYSRGGGIYMTGTATTNIYSSTIAGNYAWYAGGGYYQAGGTTVAKNSIFWDNTTASINPEIYGTITATYCDVEGSYTGTGNINLDPNFVTPAAAVQGTATTGGNFHIQTGSNVVDQGTATDAPADDIDGDSRPLGSGIDIGSDEKE